MPGTTIARHHASTGGSTLIGIVLLVLGCALAVYSLLPALRSRQWRSWATSSIGRVVALERVVGVRGSTGYRSVIEFDAGGRAFSFVGPVRGRLIRWEVGRPVGVLYDPADPQRARVADVGNAPLVGTAVGVILVVAGVVLVLR